MCLTKIHKEIKTADKDILVYKVLTSDDCAPYLGIYRYTHGLNSPMELPPSDHLTCTIIDSGYLHAYTDELCAKRSVEIFHKYEDLCHANLAAVGLYGKKKSYKVVKMYIPKGEAYWLGDAYDIAATRLEWKEDE